MKISRADAQEKKSMSLSFGALAPRISEQLEAQGLEFKTTEVVQLQRDLDAVTRLRVRGLLPDSLCEMVHRRIFRKVWEVVRQG